MCGEVVEKYTRSPGSESNSWLLHRCSSFRPMPAAACRTTKFSAEVAGATARLETCHTLSTVRPCSCSQKLFFPVDMKRRYQRWRRNAAKAAEVEDATQLTLNRRMHRLRIAQQIAIVSASSCSCGCRWKSCCSLWMPKEENRPRPWDIYEARHPARQQEGEARCSC